MNCWTKTSDLKPHHYRKIGKLVLNWCKSEFGFKKHRGMPKIIFTYKIYANDFWGYYDFDENLIVVFTNTFVNRNRTISSLIRTIIHEYTHYKQDMRGYQKLLYLHGYKNHPQEIEARNFENTWSKCYNDVKYCFPKIRK